MDVRIEESWKSVLQSEFDQEYFARLASFVKEEYKTQTVYPPAKALFRAFDLCPFFDVKVVILGQDPYHGAGQANGLCFSVGPNVESPPSLVNIFKELNDDLGRPAKADSTLESWASQGVLLLNSTLSVRSGAPTSHAGQGWERFTDAVLHTIAQKKDRVVFVLWGSYAHRKGQFIDTQKHFVLKSPHPSPLSSYRGFFGSKPFSKTNEALTRWGYAPIDW